MAGDGQVTLGNQSIKSNARKVRKLLDGKILTGFAGSTADAMTLLEKFENCLEQEKGDLMKGAVKLVREWRLDKALRRLEADVAAIGSGSGYALAAGRALRESTDYTPEKIARRSIEIASEICIYTNNNITLEVLE